MYELHEIEKRYQNLPDEKILYIARYESKDLRKDVLVILKREIVKRKLDDGGLLDWIELETKEISDFERHSLLNKIIALPCPVCSKKTTPLSGYDCSTTVSYFIKHITKKETKILCHNCGSKKRHEALIITFLLGWWSLTGFFATPYYLYQALFNQEKNSAYILNEMIDKNIGTIRKEGSDNQILQKLIKDFNDRDDKENDVTFGKIISPWH